MTRIFILISCMLLLAPAQAEDTVLARNAKIVVTKLDFEAELARIPPEQRSGYLASAQRIATTVEAIVVNKTLAVQARADAIDADPLVRAEIAAAAEKILARHVTQRHESSMKIPDFDRRAEELFKANPGKYSERDVLHARHILVDAKCRSPEAAKARALEARSALEAGAAFGDIARQFSDDPSVAKNGGDLGPLTEDRLIPAFVEAARALKPGELSQPVVTQFGVHIIKLEEIRKGKAYKFDAVRASIVAELREDWLKQERKAFVTRITADPNLKLDLDAIQALKTSVTEPAPPQQTKQRS